MTKLDTKNNHQSSKRDKSTSEGTIKKELRTNMVLVEGGEFKMGSNDVTELEKPVHKVKVSDFYINKYLTTQELYEMVMRKNPSHFKLENITKKRPVDSVNWKNTIEFCNKLSKKFGLAKAYDEKGNLLDKDRNITKDVMKVEGYRLPTEAEWEYAAKGGKKSKGFKFAGSDSLDQVAWYAANSGQKPVPPADEEPEIKRWIREPYPQTHQVGQKKPNELGLYDMSGNVDEWCQDCYDKVAYQKHSYLNPCIIEIDKKNSKILRGGGFTYPINYCNLATRNPIIRSVKRWDIGFRIVRSK